MSKKAETDGQKSGSKESNAATHSTSTGGDPTPKSPKASEAKGGKVEGQDG